MTAILHRFNAFENVAHRLLVRHSIVATMECFIGICFLIGSATLMRMVIAAGAFRGGRLVRPEPQSA